MKEGSIGHSKEFLEGYNSKSQRVTNPYAVGQPWLAEYPDKVILKKCNDWFDGWEHRFYGKEI